MTWHQQHSSKKSLTKWSLKNVNSFILYLERFSYENSRLIAKNAMILSLNATNKADAISEMVQKLVDTGYVTDYDTFKDGILAREALTTTGLGDGIAMPHSKNAAVKEAVVLFAKKDGGLDYESLDGQPTDLFFMIAAPDGVRYTFSSTC